MIHQGNTVEAPLDTMFLVFVSSLLFHLGLIYWTDTRRYRYNSKARASVAEAPRSAASRVNYLPRRITTLFKHPRRLAHATSLAFSHHREHHFIVARSNKTSDWHALHRSRHSLRGGTVETDIRASAIERSRRRFLLRRGIKRWVHRARANQHHAHWGLVAARFARFRSLKGAMRDLRHWTKEQQAIGCRQRQIQAMLRRRQVLRRKRLGVLGLELWTEGRRATGVLKWRAGIWRRIFLGKKALKKWQRHAQHQQDIELAAWITERRKRRWKGATSPYAIQQAVVRALCNNAWACRLRRSVFNAWAAHSCLMVRAKKQVRESHLRSGFDGFRSWALSSLRKRGHHLHALRHAVHRTKHATYIAWKNYVFPTGLSLRRSLPLRVVRSDGIMLPSRETSSYVTLLHLPIIRIRMQRVLNGWRRVVVQGKRRRYVDDSLPLKTTRVHSESSHKDYLGTDNKRLQQRRLGVRVRSGESTSMRRFEESIVGGDGGMILAKHGNTPAGSRAQDFDHPRQPRAKLYGGFKGGSYLEQYLIKTSGK